MSAPIQFDTLPASALLREREILPIIPFSSPTLRRRIQAGEFPEPIQLEGRMKCWRWGDVKSWLEAQGQPEKAA